MYTHTHFTRLGAAEGMFIILGFNGIFASLLQSQYHTCGGSSPYFYFIRLHTLTHEGEIKEFSISIKPVLLVLLLLWLFLISHLRRQYFMFHAP
jgi:hypothetical protein